MLLRDKAGGAPRNITRVLRHLTADDPEREARCWTDASLAVLRERGVKTGLTAFLEEASAALRAALGLPPGDDAA